MEYKNLSSFKNVKYEPFEIFERIETYDFFVYFGPVCYMTVNHVLHNNLWNSFAKFLLREK